MCMNKAGSFLGKPTLHNLPSIIFSETEVYITGNWKKKTKPKTFTTFFLSQPLNSCAQQNILPLIRWPSPATRSQVALTSDSMANVSFVNLLTKLQSQQHHRHEIVHWDEHQNILIKYKMKPNRIDQKICCFSLAKSTTCNQNRVCWKGNKYSLQHLHEGNYSAVFFVGWGTSRSNIFKEIQKRGEPP